jgi:hypothetical protein
LKLCRCRLDFQLIFNRDKSSFEIDITDLLMNVDFSIAQQFVGYLVEV